MSTRKKGEDIYAYTRILKYRNKRYGIAIKDVILLIVTIIISLIISIHIYDNVLDKYSAIIFIINFVFLLFLLLAFVDFSFGLGLFKEKRIFTSSIVLLTSIIISAAIAGFATKIFPQEANPENLSLISLANLIFVSVIISYYIITSTPNRQGREQMIKNLTEIKEEVTRLSITELGLKEAIERSIKWLQYQQTDTRIWGENEPLYETSEIMRVFLDIGLGLNHSWKDIKSGEEDIHRLEQTYYLLIDTLEKAKIEPKITILSALLTIAQINPDNLTIESSRTDETSKLAFKNGLKTLFEEFEEELKTQSEWDFVAELEKIDDSFTNRQTLPSILYFSRIFHLIDNKELYIRCGEIFAETFNILINRSDSRFSSIEQKEIPNYILGLMYNTLSLLLRPPVIIGDELEPDTLSGGMEKDLLDDLPGAGGLSLPGFDDFDFSDDSDEDTLQTASGPKLTITISQAAIRNLIRKKQEIDGSWSARIDTTAECLIAVIDRESAESEFVKIAVHYLLALQEKNGSWQDDSLLTSLVIKSLHKVYSSIGGL